MSRNKRRDYGPQLVLAFQALSDLETKIEIIFMAHKGRRNAIPRKELCRMLPHVNERRLRSTIKHLIIRHGLPICSGPEGYFWADTPGEVQEVYDYYRSYGLSALYVASKLKKIPLKQVIEEIGQMDFEFLEVGHDSRH